jgi:hypothetical protein
MDDRRAFLRGATVDPRQLPSEIPPPPDLPGFGSAAAGRSGAPQGRDARRSGASQIASGLRLPSVRQAPLSPPPRPMMTRPDDLVARALAILAEEDAAWQARRVLDRTPRSVR